MAKLKKQIITWLHPRVFYWQKNLLENIYVFRCLRGECVLAVSKNYITLSGFTSLEFPHYGATRALADIRSSRQRAIFTRTPQILPLLLMHTVLSFLCKKSEYHQESRSPERLKRGEICKFSKKKQPEDYRVLPKERSRNLILYPLRHECSIMEKKRCSFLEALLLFCASLSLKLKPPLCLHQTDISSRGVPFRSGSCGHAVQLQRKCFFFIFEFCTHKKQSLTSFQLMLCVI